MQGSQDRIDCAVELTKLAETLLRHQLSLVAMDAYVDELERFDLDEVLLALRWCRGNLDHFPMPVEVKEQIYSIRRRQHDDRKSLAPAPTPPAERAAVRLLIKDAIAKYGPEAPDLVIHEPTPEERSEHERRRQAAREQLARLDRSS